MSHYKHVPFTSNLQMWSPSSSSISLDYNMTEFPYSTAVSTQTAANYYHHEPLFYPAACIICGLFHHPVPHTTMNSATQQPSSVVVATTATTTITILTPAPSTSSLPIIPLERKRKMKHGKMTRKMKYRFIKYIQMIYHKFIYAFKISFKKRHNIYPLKRHG